MTSKEKTGLTWIIVGGAAVYGDTTLVIGLFGLVMLIAGLFLFND